MPTKKFFSSLFIISITVLVLSFAQHGKEGFENLAFTLHASDREGDRKMIRDAVHAYNRYSARFYSVGGTAEGLNEIPAAPLLKRRLFKDITMLKRDGLVMVFDRDREEFRKVYFTARNTAVAETDEVWFVALQDLKTRKSVLGVKAGEIKARYILRRELRGWIIYEVDVYPASEDIPLLDRSPAL